mmetsp:Transcript_26282/g.42971  ORF Transcript_26282/g.42971 Transcript_26282/m.42971 type:complete len:173 (-) Transcript_26282:204-722(-)|eukprot:CAMPEP_0202726394 /NCGR_PEP_ID=MMETSP1385-20130828/184592_1 /ASSEMBLY_ACC=CAM_ASM_000861 /TAXON_ID=933848 /ORGANISM="Elphidium margaritaceum" /LENGTH=172 /DNA_ID=CAMNT_0049392615 /DNA_START=1185 /DNA_END=1703 /DNA_ORIENTATION=-
MNVTENPSFLTDRPKGIVTQEMLDEDQRELARNPTINKILRNPRSGYRTKLEYWNWGWGGFVRHDMPECPKRILEETDYCKPIKGGGASRRCPNTNRGCQMFFNYQKFLQCYNRFEHRGEDKAMAKCRFFLTGVAPQVIDWFEELRENKDWAGIKSNYKPLTEDDDDDDDDE